MADDETLAAVCPHPPQLLPGADHAPSTDEAKIVVAIPSRNEAATIGGVVSAAVEGLRRLGAEDTAVLVNCDNGSTDGTPDAFIAAARPLRSARMSVDGAITGKGSNVLRLLEYCRAARADRMVLLDADVRSIEPEWIERLLDSVDRPDPVIATPVYRRNRFEGNTTNHIAWPLMRAVFGRDVRQPIAGDFAFNLPFVELALTWPVPDSARLYGIDIWLTANAASQGTAIASVPLGRKIHNPGFPKILYGSQQVIDALLHAVVRHGRISPSDGVLGPRCSADEVAMRPDGALVVRATRKVRTYIAAHAERIGSVLPASRNLQSAAWGFRVGIADWAELLADGLRYLATTGELATTRDDLVAMYFCRVMTYWDEIDGLTAQGVDRMLTSQTDAICEAVCQRPVPFPDSIPPVGFTAGYWAPEVP